MSDGGDPAIKLFGKTIPLAEGQTSPETREILDLDEKDSSKEITSTEITAPMSDVQQVSDNSKPNSSFGFNNVSEDDRQTSGLDVKVIEASKTEPNDSEFDTSSQEKALKKPDKILPCPRCNSLTTKFCYYNNYNINQPRHFCKNCQRYWTAGGTMRNVPEGAGRRKSKHSASHFRKIAISSDGFPCNPVGIRDSSHQPASGVLKGNESVIKFGPEAKFPESMNSVLNLGDEKKYTEIDSDPVEKREETKCASFTVKSVCAENDCAGTEVKTEQCETRVCSNGVDPMHHMQHYPLPPFVIPWTPTWNNVAAMPVTCGSSELVYGPDNGNKKPFTWNPSAMLAPPAFFSPMIAFPVMPTPFWGCVANWPNGACSAPCNGLLPPLSSVSNGGCSANGSPTLGKHSRIAAGLEGEEKMEKKSLWAPKTLRICDPDEASKSSIWATLDIKPGESISNGDGVFKSFRSKTVRKDQTADVNQALHANPAALCRSQKFQEST